MPDLYSDIYLPFPAPASSASNSSGKSKKDKGKGKAVEQAEAVPEKPRSCWDGLAASERLEVSQMIGMAGHLGCTIVACTIPTSTPGQIPPNPFLNSRPFPAIDPRNIASSSKSSQQMVQLSRLHIVIDDSIVHGLTSSNTNVLNQWDIISVMPVTMSAFSAACLSLTQPGSNQVSIITLPLHHAPKMPFPFKRSLVKQALRHGAVFELLYLPAFFSSPNTSPDVSKRHRQNFLTNAREVVRVTGGKGVILSSGPGGNGSWGGMRGPADLINLACLIGMEANQAKVAIAETPRKVLLKAQARKHYKGVVSAPRMVMPTFSATDGEDEAQKRKAAYDESDRGSDWTNKKIRLDE